MSMFIQENLSRQLKGLTLLMALLEEEFARLMRHESQRIPSLELSIQELMRQIAAERTSLKRMVQQLDPDAQRVRDVLSIMDEERSLLVEEVLERMNKQEQKCGVQAQKNQQLVLALYDQSTKLLNYMHKQIVPPENKGSYLASGRYAKSGAGQASLVRGTF